MNILKIYFTLCFCYLRKTVQAQNIPYQTSKGITILPIQREAINNLVKKQQPKSSDEK